MLRTWHYIYPNIYIYIYTYIYIIIYIYIYYYIYIFMYSIYIYIYIYYISSSNSSRLFNVVPNQAVTTGPVHDVRCRIEFGFNIC